MANILITGANQGIGLALATELAKDSTNQVIVTARRAEEGERVASQIGADFYSLDVTSNDSVKHLVKDLKIDSLDVLINNAGIWGEGEQNFPTLNLESLRQVMETNLYGVINVTQKLFPRLQKSSGARILNISSGLGQFQDVGPGSLAYRASKAALNMFTANAAAELKDSPVKIVSVCPGWVQTHMGGPNATLTPEEAAGKITPLVTKPDLESGKFYRFGKVIDW